MVDIENMITNTDHKISLSLIKAAVENIWTNEMRIIKDYTDHGYAHSKRLEIKAASIVNANGGMSMTSEEAYLLLAGIYLHDIGMQCDVIKFPKIKEIAENDGATFNIKFTADKSSSYSTEEHNEIRMNHHYLSAAWIQHASQELDRSDPLINAAQNIPRHLVDDLMDVCKYHTKLSISKCPPEGKVLRNIRKMLVAAILRFADELDIDADRVTLEIYRLFNMKPENAVYWWLHGQTSIIFYRPSLILMEVSLNVQDTNKCPELINLVENTYINRFKIKNEPVLSTLALHGISLVISYDSGVVTTRRAVQILPDFIDVLKKDNEPAKLLLHRKVVSLDNLLSSITRNDEEKVEILSKWADRYQETGQVAAVSDFLNEAQNILSYSTNKDWARMTEIGLAQAVRAWRSAEFAAALQLSNLNIDFASNIKDEKTRNEMLQKSYIHLAFALLLNGKHPQALIKLQEADTINEAGQQSYTWQDNYRRFEILVADAERASWSQFLGVEIIGTPLEDAKKAIDNIINLNISNLSKKQVTKLNAKDCGVYHLLLGRLALYTALCSNNNKLNDAHEHLETAMSNLRGIGEGLIPACLESRAWLRKLEDDENGSKKDLDESMWIVTQGSMIAHKTDLLLYRARLFFRTKPYPWKSLQTDIEDANKLIQDNGYGRRQAEIEDAKKAMQL